MKVKRRRPRMRVGFAHLYKGPETTWDRIRRLSSPPGDWLDVVRGDPSVKGARYMGILNRAIANYAERFDVWKLKDGKFYAQASLLPP